MASEAKLKIVVDAQNRTQRVFNELSDNLDAIQKKNHGLIRSMETVGMVGTAAFAGLSVLTAGIIKAGASYEQTEVAFTTMLGSAELARKKLAELAQFSAKTPFQLPELESTSKKLLAYGVSADDLLPTLRTLGDLASTVGMDKLPQLTLAFGQLKSKTVLSGEELRQFMETGLPLIEELAKVTGLSRQQLTGIDGDVKDLGVTFEQVQKALTNMTSEGGIAFGAMANQSRTLGGLWSTFSENVTLTARSIGNELLPYLKPMVIELTNMVQHVGEFVKQHPQLSAILLVAALGFTAILAVLLPIAIALPGIILLFGGLAAAFAFVVTGPGAALVVAIFAIVSALRWLYEQGYFTKQAWLEMWAGIKMLAADGANAVIGVTESMLNFIIKGVNMAIAAINKVIGMAQKVPGIGKSISKIGTLESVSLGRYDSQAIAANVLNKPAQQQSLVLNITGNTLLDRDAATKMGDLIMGKLRLSNQL